MQSVPNRSLYSTLVVPGGTGWHILFGLYASPIGWIVYVRGKIAGGKFGHVYLSAEVAMLNG